MSQSSERRSKAYYIKENILYYDKIWVILRLPFLHKIIFDDVKIFISLDTFPICRRLVISPDCHSLSNWLHCHSRSLWNIMLKIYASYHRSRISAKTRQRRIQPASKSFRPEQCNFNDESCLRVNVGDSGSFKKPKLEDRSAESSAVVVTAIIKKLHNWFLMSG